MNRQLKKMIKEHKELESKWCMMTVHNSTDEERREAWIDLRIKKKEIAFKCAELLGVKDEDDAIAIGTSVGRGNLLSYLRQL